MSLGTLDRRKQIQIAIIVVCLVGAVLGYWLLSRESPPPQAEAVSQREQQINQAVQQQADTQPAPQEIQRTAPRGRIPAPGGG
jgi:hypothetical protein